MKEVRDPPAVRELALGSTKVVVTLSDILKDTAATVPPKPSTAEAKEKTKEGLIYICEGIPPLQAKLVQAIEKGEFVEFANLLPRSASWEEDPFAEVTDKIVVLTQGKAIPKKEVY